MKSSSFCLLCSFFWIWLSPMFLSAQIKNDAVDFSVKLKQTDKKPKIGLALSGGAAHGLAHIGVVKYLEELGIEIDYITGTSMGSIVGGLMAMGYDAQQLIHIAATQNWQLILSNKIPLPEVASYEKFQHDKFLIDFIYEKGTLGLPKGFLAGQKLDLLISKLFLPAFDLNNFNDLPIPFQCFAVDLTSGEIVTLKDGFLGRAIRTSMAIPSVFTPVEIDGKLLVDGGLIRNFPVSNNIEMGSDIVIGSYVGSQLEDKESLISLVDIMKQSAAMLSITDSQEQKELCDVLIEPQTKELPVFSFSNYKELISVGYEAAKKNEKKLMELADHLKQFSSNPKRKILRFPDSIRVNFVSVENSFEPFEQLVKDKLSIKNGTFLTVQKLEDKISNVYGTKNFGNISYALEGQKENANLKVFAPPKEDVQLSLNVNHFRFYSTALVINGTFRNVFARPSRLSVMGKVSDNPALQLDYVYRLGSQKNFLVGFDVITQRRELPLFADQGLINRFNNSNVSGKLKLIWEPNNSALFQLGFSANYDEIKNRIIQNGLLRKYSRGHFRIGVSYEYNKRDHNYFPTKGIYFNFKTGLQLSRTNNSSYFNNPTEPLELNEPTSNFEASIEISLPKKITKSLVSLSSVSAYYSAQDDLLNFVNVGGVEHNRKNHISFIGKVDNQYSLNKATVIAQTLRYTFFEKLHLYGKANFLIGENYVSEIFNPFEEDRIENVFGYGFGAAIDSPIGPISIEIGNSNQNSTKISYALGHQFIF